MNEDKAKEELVRLYWEDPILCLRGILPHWYPDKMPWFHRGIVALVLGRADFLLNFGTEIWPNGQAEWTVEDLELIVQYFQHQLDPDDPESKKVPLFEVERDAAGFPVACHMTTSRFMELMIPRGFSKTTLFNGLMLYIILYKIENFIVYLSETAGHAQEQLQNVKAEIEGNEVVNELWGQLNPERNDPEKWTGDFIQTLNGVAVKALGRGGQVRGKNIGGNRPGIILLDDVEDDESVLTEEQRRKTLTWLMKAVRPALPRRGGKIFVLGTMLHMEAMMVQLSRDPEWITVRFGAMLDNGQALWPRQMTQKEWMKTRESYKRQGMLSEFYMEYQNSIHVDADNRKFKPENWRVVVMERAQFVATALAMDPAISEEKGADSCTFAVTGITERGLLHVLDMHAEKGMHPRAQVDKYFELHFKWDVLLHGIESVAYQRALIHLMTEEMARKAQTFGSRAYFEIIPILHGKTGKVPRIEGILAPRYSAGYITHQRRFSPLESEAIDWPKGKKDNLDVVAMSIALLDPMATFAGPPEDHIDLPRDAWAQIQDGWEAQCP